MKLQPLNKTKSWSYANWRTLGSTPLYLAQGTSYWTRCPFLLYSWQALWPCMLVTLLSWSTKPSSISHLFVVIEKVWNDIYFSSWDLTRGHWERCDIRASCLKDPSKQTLTAMYRLPTAATEITSALLMSGMNVALL